MFSASSDLATSIASVLDPPLLGCPEEILTAFETKGRATEWFPESTTARGEPTERY
jgi:hypothetical protein